MNDLTVNFRHLDRNSLLNEWRWLIGAEKQPVLITALGNVFVQDSNDDSISLVDVGMGKIFPVAASAAEFRSLLNDKAFVHRELLAALVVKLREAGKLLEPGQVYSYKVLPRLGGGFGPENLQPCDISVHFSIVGQLHRQVAGLPIGTPVSISKHA